MKFKNLADKKHEIFDEDLQSLVSHTHSHTLVDVYELGEMEVVCKTGQSPHAKVEVKIHGKSVSADAIGSGPVDATFKAIESLVKSGSNLKLYSVNAITQGTDSLGDVTVRLEHDGQIVNGVGADTDIVTASAKAYLHALNLLNAHAVKAHPQRGGI